MKPGDIVKPRNEFLWMRDGVRVPQKDIMVFIGFKKSSVLLDYNTFIFLYNGQFVYRATYKDSLEDELWIVNI